MDDAAQRAALRGLKLLERCRALRRDDAARALSQRLREADAAKAAEDEARADLVQHRSKWLAREDALMAAYIGGTVPGLRFRAGRDDLDTLADGTIRRLACLGAARAATGEAAAAAEAARIALAARQRRLQQTEALGGRLLVLHDAAAEAAAEQEADDDLAMRYGGLRCRR